MFEESLPFQEKINGNFRIRKFSEALSESELKWHTDNENRIVKPLHETDWKLQIDNELPMTLIKNKEYFIPKDVYHRVIKGNGNLEILVTFL